MILKSFDAITLSDIEQLVANGVSEGRTLEFKRELPGNKDDEIKEFLADITSIANTDGGDVVYGIVDRDGIAADAPGAALVLSVDDTILRLENLLRDCVEPRLSGFRLRWLPKGGSTGILIARVPASLSSPHRVIFRGWGKFFHRNSGGKAEMDTHELRLAFTSTEALPARLRHLHTNFADMVRANDLPITLVQGARIVVSLIPLDVVRASRALRLNRENSV